MAELVDMSGDDIYHNFHTGPGSGGLAGAADLVRDLAKEFEESVDSITELMVTMESAWQGDAAGAAKRGAGPMVTAHALAVGEIETAQDLSHRQVGSFERMKSAVVPVPPLPDGPVPWPGFDRKRLDYVAYENQVAAHNAASEHNVDQMTQYESDSAYNTDNMPDSFGPPIESVGAPIEVIIPPSPLPPVPKPTPAPPPPPPRPGGPHGPGGRSSPPVTQVGPRQPAPEHHDVVGPQDTLPSQQVSPPVDPNVRLTNVDIETNLVNPRFTNEFLGIGVFESGGNQPVVRGHGGAGGGPGGADGEVRRGTGLPGRGAVPSPGGVPAAEGTRVGGGGSGARAGSGGGAAGGVPGVSEGDEDLEHARPEWLEGGDPEELFGTDEMTAPPVIGAAD